jgi:hypothetical protein
MNVSLLTMKKDELVAGRLTQMQTQRERTTSSCCKKRGRREFYHATIG